MGDAIEGQDGPGRRRVLLASNRGPVSFSRGDNGRLAVRRGGGGVVSGLSSVARREDVLWVCAALSDADRAAASGAGLLDLDGRDLEDSDGGGGDGSGGGGDGSGGGDGRIGRSAVRMLDIPTATFNRAYNTVANSVLWFVHHMLYDMPNRPRFTAAFRRDWAAYRDYNLAFARALHSAAGGPAAGGPAAGGPAAGRPPADGPPADASSVRVFVQDYHLDLAPRMLAEMWPVPGQRPRIAHFSHTPWAPVDYYRLLPDDIGAEVLDGILAADHAGFLCQRWADAFADCCEQLLGAEVDRDRWQVRHRGHVTSIGVHPLGVDARGLKERAAENDVGARLARLAETVGDRKLIVRVDRTELSKNIVRGLGAYHELLAQYPQWQGKVIMLALAYPSRHDLPEYREYAASVQRVARSIEDEFGTPDWTPILLRTDDDYPRSLAAYRLADVLLVNPIRDGMNLVAKEGPILSERGCVLVLSREAGAAAELGEDALLVNPFDVAETATALHRALTMDDFERNQRCHGLAQAASALPPTAWFASQLAALDRAAAAQ